LAADILLSLEECSGNMVSIADILIKFDSIFCNVLSPEALLEEFYNAKQVDETVATWAGRLENLRRQLQEGSMAQIATLDMLRSKLWSGLNSRSVKNATRHHFDTGVSYSEL